MYMRFVTPLRDWDTGAETGFFHSAWYLRRIGAAEWIHRELRQQFDWFNQHLPLPGRVARHFKRRASIYGLCWFAPDALECIRRARYCAWLIGEGGLPVRIIRMRTPREIIWRDGHQVVMKPTAETPRAFPGPAFPQWS